MSYYCECLPVYEELRWVKAEKRWVHGLCGKEIERMELVDIVALHVNKEFDELLTKLGEM